MPLSHQTFSHTFEVHIVKYSRANANSAIHQNKCDHCETRQISCTWTTTEPSMTRARCDNCKGKKSRKCNVNETTRTEITTPRILARFIGSSASSSKQREQQDEVKVEEEGN
jgi:hypothetical protein